MRTVFLLWITCFEALAQIAGVTGPVRAQRPAATGGGTVLTFEYISSTTGNNGDLVTTIPDTSGNNHPLYVFNANSASYSPYLTNSVINGLSAMYFAGTSSSAKLLTNNLGQTFGPSCTMYIVAKCTATGGQTQYFWDTESGATRMIFAENQSLGNFDLGVYCGTAWQNSGINLSGLGWCVYTVYYNAGSSYVRTNGALHFTVSSTPGSQGSAGLALGGQYQASSSGFKGWIAELKGHSGTPDLTIESALRTKYGL